MPSPPATATVGDEDVYAADFFVGKRKVGSDGGVCKLVQLPAILPLRRDELASARAI